MGLTSHAITNPNLEFVFIIKVGNEETLLSVTDGRVSFSYALRQKFSEVGVLFDAFYLSCHQVPNILLDLFVILLNQKLHL